MAGDTDISEFLAGLKKAGNAQIAAAHRAVDLFGLQVLGNAQDKAPVLTGALKASATDLPSELQGEVVVKLIGFNIFYAVMVHEILTAHHNQGQAKFLESAIRELAPKFGPFVAGQVKGGGR